MKLKQRLDEEYKRRVTLLQTARKGFVQAVEQAMIEHAKREGISFHDPQTAKGRSLSEFFSGDPFELPEGPAGLEQTVLGHIAANHYDRVLDMAEYAEDDLCELAQFEKEALMCYEHLPRTGTETPPDMLFLVVGLELTSENGPITRRMDRVLQPYFVRLSAFVDNLYETMINYHEFQFSYERRRHQLHDQLRTSNEKLRRHLRDYFHYNEIPRTITKLRNQLVHNAPAFGVSHDLEQRTPFELPSLVLETEEGKKVFFNYVSRLYTYTLEHTAEAMRILLAEKRPQVRKT